MDTTLMMYGQQNDHVQPNSQQYQQILRREGHSNTYPQYPEANNPQRAQFNPGYGQQTSTTYQQLTTNPWYRPIQNNYENVNANQQTAYDYAQTNVPHQWQVNKCQMTTWQDPTFPGNWSNQGPPKMTPQTETFPYQNMQNSVCNPNLMPMKLNYLPENVKTTVSHNGGGYQESNTDSTFRWTHTATHRKQVETTRKTDARKNDKQTPYTASTRLAPPRFIPPRRPMPLLEATFESSGQLPVSQTHLQLKSAAGAAHAFSNSPVFRAQPQYRRHNLTSHLVNPNNPGRKPPPSYACKKAVAVVQPLLQKNTQVTAKKSCPERFGQQKDTLIAGCVDNIEIHGNTLSNRFQPLPECDGSEKKQLISSGADQKHQSNANVEPTDDGTVTLLSLLSNGNGKGKESEAHQSVTLDSSQGKEIQKSGAQESETDDVGPLSVVPVRTWTHKQLTTLIEISTQVQIEPDHSKAVVGRLVKHLWDNDMRKVLSLLKTNHYIELMAVVIKYCKATQDSPILSQVEDKSWHELKEKCTVLEHGSVYFESPYVSPWLNVNLQLDDIDNEFGFPSTLKNCESTCNAETKPMETKCVIPVDFVKEIAIENVRQMAPALDLVEKARSILQTKCTQSIVPDEALTADLSDPLDLLEIEMMHPDQARIVFEQLKNGSSLIEFQSDEVSTTEKTRSMEEFCCINRWIEMILGTEPSLECPCKSRSESNKPSEKENIVEVSLSPMHSNSSKVSKIIDCTKQFEVAQEGYDNTPITPPTTMDSNEEEIINNILSSINGSILTSALEKNCNKELKPTHTEETLNIESKQPKDHDDDHAAVCDKHPITESSDDHMSTPKAVLTMEQKQPNSDAHDFESIGLTTGLTRLSPTVRPKGDCSPNLKMRLGLSRKRKRTIGKVISMDALDPSVQEKIIEVSLNRMRSNSSKVSKIIDCTKQFEVPKKGNDNTPITPPSTMDSNEEEEIINEILSSIYGTIALENNCNKELKPARLGETLNIEPKQPKDHHDDHAAVCDKHPITESSDDHMSTPKAVLTMEQKKSNSNAHDLESISLTTGPTRLSPTVKPKGDCSPNLKMRLRLSRKRKRSIGKVMQPLEDPVASVHQPALKDSSNDLIKEKVVADDSTTKKTVKLALFGTTAHKSGVSGPRGRSHSLSQFHSRLPHPPPSFITVTCCSVKNQICEKWRKSYLPITRKNGKCKTNKDINWNATSATIAPVEAELVDMERLPASLEQTFPLGSGKKRGRRKSSANILTLETTQMPNKSVTKKQLVNSKSKSKNPKGPDMRRKENRGLRLLRQHLGIKAGPRRRKGKRASVLETSDGSAMDNGLKTTIQKSAGWARIPDKKHHEASKSFRRQMPQGDVWDIVTDLA